ncbi:unnamed protein product [Alternaria alternata]|uniref:Carboxylic ester hydrolase n=1 Tax=Alternaria alternata TaxID=5599 RepID=A0A4Q4NGR3_ALTAL|nr:hypothetical protein AA0117_g6634 [Alternaria alternata]
MTLYSSIGNCTPSAVPYPVILGAEFVAIEAQPVLNYNGSDIENRLWHNHGLLPTNASVNFCNVTLTHTHPGKDDMLHTQIWLPLHSTWNRRMVDGGVQIENALSVASWALTSPGNVDYNALQNFAFNGLIDGAMATKQVIESFYGHGPDYSYWNGCSQGGRQGYMFAQKFPKVFDGIAAAAPAINWSSFFFSSTFPQQVLSELAQNGLKRFPHECEFLSLRRAAIAACDANGGPVDGLISDMASCKFDARSMIGSPSNCSSPGAPSVISEAAAMAMNALWQGAQTSDGSFLWYPHGYQTDPTAFYGTLDNTCSDNGTCVPERNTLFTHWIKYFVKKDPDFDLNNMTRQDFVRAFNAGTRDYNSIIDTDYPDLRELRAAGGKLLTYHGLADQSIPYGGTGDYYDRVSALHPALHDFYRYFEVPGAAHCEAGQGGVPTGLFSALVDWVENGIAPETLVARNAEDRERLLCQYPKKAVFTGDSANYTVADFVCQ